MEFTEVAKHFGLATGIIFAVGVAAYFVLRRIGKIAYERLFSDRIIEGPDGNKHYRGVVLRWLDEQIRNFRQLVENFGLQVKGMESLVIEDRRQTELLERILQATDNQYPSSATNRMVVQLANLIYVHISGGSIEKAREILQEIERIGAKYSKRNTSDSDAS